MEIGDVHFETWWNALSQECRDNILQLIPTMGPDQRTIFSGRRWHELQAEWPIGQCQLCCRTRRPSAVLSCRETSSMATFLSARGVMTFEEPTGCGNG